jgi:hypothetical protein
MLCSAGVDALQFVFNNGSYESTAKRESCQIFKEGVHLAGASVSKMATLLGVSRVAVPKVMMAYTNHMKTPSAERNSGRNQN